jgi:hypothetical protein
VRCILLILSFAILILGMIYLLKNIIIYLPGILLGIIITVRIQSQVYLWKKWFFSNKLAQFSEFKRILIIFDKIVDKLLIIHKYVMSVYPTRDNSVETRKMCDLGLKLKEMKETLKNLNTHISNLIHIFNNSN